MPLILLLSKGGIGGRGQTFVDSSFGGSAAYTGDAGVGGIGGDVLLQLQSSVSTQGKRFAIARITSQGGDAGNDGGAHRSTVNSTKAMGGTGGRAAVEVAAGAHLSTSGLSAPAVIVESKGGNGGSGANDGTRIGGTGGSSGVNETDAAVYFKNEGIVSTSGGSSPVVVLQSIGGNGGAGSAYGAGHGTAGGLGGRAGAILAENSGMIVSEEAYSFGIVAQSVGGTGGTGGSALFSGGKGGSAGKGGTVTIRNTGAIATKGSYATGIVAQSIGGGNALDAFRAFAPFPAKISPGGGGGGGDGGDAIFGLFFSSGGNGGTGGDGNTISIERVGYISTMGDGAMGLLAQSIGGSGGRAGDATAAGGFLAIALGGNGGGGGNGGSVFVGSKAEAQTFAALKLSDPVAAAAGVSSITTRGKDAIGILAHSVGGGGGVGGSAKAFSGGAVASVSVAVGGSGGKGGDGKDVSVWNITHISTLGDNATGIQAQSIGGGGGNAGDASAYALAITGGPLPAVAIPVSVGGSGGDGGHGDKVLVSNLATITTDGSLASAIDAQSIGGGGGRAASATAYAYAIQTGPMPAISIPVTIGGSGGKGGNGNAVEVENSGKILTTGNQSVGIDARSIGGGGGIAGDATSSASIMSAYFNVGIPVSIGGSGGGGGKGGDVTITNSGSIETQGNFSEAINVLSIGGGGGKGGTAESASGVGFSVEWLEDRLAHDVADKVIDQLASNVLPLADSVTTNVNIGGSGGSGGAGGVVTVTNKGSILTQGLNSSAIYALSVGGGGGYGGGYAGGGKAGTVAINVSVGGSGGDGGKGGNVTIINEAKATIVTQEEGSHGIFVQSVGGGGGYGGSFTGQQAKSTDYSNVSGWISAAGKLAGEVQRINKTYKAVKGQDKPADNDPDRKALDEARPEKGESKTSKRLGYIKSVMTIGKELANKNRDWRENIVMAVMVAEIEALKTALKKELKATKDKLASNALGNRKPIDYLPSVGINVAVGGSAGDGGAGGVVTITNNGKISTKGGMSYGVFAQSVGGGGGTAGGAYVNGNNYMNVNVTVGGTGGKGGIGGAATVTNKGTIETQGYGSYGLFAQSIGGGGGVGGAATSTNSLSASVAFNVGGNGGASGNGGVVTITNEGLITTHGKDAHALVGQSVGGGGGVYFLNIADPASKKGRAAASVTREVQEAIEATNEFLKAIGIDPAAGDQPTGTNSTTTVLPTLAANVTLGGRGKAAGNGDKVTLTHAHRITTTNDGAFGIFGQSIGGGGGFGSDSSAGGRIHLDFVVGGTGGAAGNGSNVTINLNTPVPGSNLTSIRTSGRHAHAIVAQSIGGGGGFGGAAHYRFVGDFIADGGSSGNGGPILIQTNYPAARRDYAIATFVINTTGEQAHGIYAQSLGGGGGAVANLAGVPVPIKSTKPARTNVTGNGGKIEINTAGTISAKGKNSYGIFAQSGVQASDGSIQQPGVNYYYPPSFSQVPVYVRPIETPIRTGDDIKITHYGDITGGSGMGAAIRIDGGKNNTITLREGTVSALSGEAILATWGNETVENYGTLIGNVKLDGGFKNEVNKFINAGIYRTVDKGVIELGNHANSVFTNRGVFDIRGSGGLTKTSLVGHLAMETGSKLQFNISPQGAVASDTLHVSGKVTFAAGVELQPVSLFYLNPGYYHILSADGGISGTRPSVTGVSNGVVPVDWQLRGPWDTPGGSSTPFTNIKIGDKNNLILAPQPSFNSPKSVQLTTDQRAVAAQLQQAWNAGSLANANVFAYFLRQTDPNKYARDLDELAPDSIQEASAPWFYSARVGVSMALSCPAFSGDGTLLQEGDCVWGKMQAEQTRFNDRLGTHFTRDTLAYRVGAQKEIAPDWFLGLAGAYITSDHRDRDGVSNADAHGFEGAIALKHQIGPWQFAAAAIIGQTWQDNVRYIDFDGLGLSARSKSETLYAGARLRASYEFAFKDWYIRPYVDADAIHQRNPASRESGAPGMNLDIRSNSKTIYALSPNVEIGTRFDIAPDYWIRPYGTIGFTLLSHDTVSSRASLQGASIEAGSFETVSPLPHQLFDVGAGVQIYAAEGIDFTAEYKASKASGYLSHTGSAKLSVRF